MPKSKKRKQPVTSSRPSSSSSSPPGFSSCNSGSNSSSSSTSTRTVIRRFHVLLKRQAHLRRFLDSGSDATSGDPNRKKEVEVKDELKSIEGEMERMGGLEAYQRMSIIGQGKDRGGGSEKVFIRWLQELGEPEKLKESQSKLRLLEVGALKPDNYAPWSAWVDPFPIDLHSQHPAIQEQDFLLMSEEEHQGKWDAISLSLVLNFVPEPKDRGRMLRLAYGILREGGYLFVALPLPCVLNSRYLTPELFHEIMDVLSFKRLFSQWKIGGKMAYWLFQKLGTDDFKSGRVDSKFTTKSVLRQGNRNNFVISL